MSTTSCLSRVSHNLPKDSAILLNNKHEITIGRSYSADIIILSTMISKKHALLKETQDGKWTITDQYSTNGIFVNKNKVSPGFPKVLYFGDIIHLGKWDEKYSDYFLYFFKHDRNVEEHIIEHSFKTIDQNNCKLKKFFPKTENKIFLLRKGTKIPLASKRKFEMSVEILEAEKQIKKMKKQLTEKERAEQKLRQEMAKNERQITAALKNEQEEKNKLQNYLEAELKTKEEALFDLLKNEKDKYLETKMNIEKELQQEMEKKIEKKIKETEEKLLAEKGKLEKIIATKELEHIFLEKQLETVQAENLAQKDLAFQISEGILRDISQIVEVELQCIICSELFIQATTLNCSHTFCGACISDWCKKKKQCPICRCKIKNSTISLVIDNYIDKIVEVLSDDMKVNRKKLIEERQKAASGSQNTYGNPISDYNNLQDDTETSDSSVEDNNGLYYRRYGNCTICGSPNHLTIECPF